jgi:hypothetical protein
MKLKLVEYIKNNQNWERDLQLDPFYLTITKMKKFTLFYYNQIKSEFNNDIVRECRGLILDNEFNPVCVPFFKFGNYGESYNEPLDWTSTKIQEKIDGSIIKVWNYNNTWNISTSKTICAANAILLKNNDNKFPYKSFEDLFMKAIEIYNLNFDTLNTNYTYIFELCSPYNRVVVPHNEIKLFHIGTRDNKSLQELNIDIGIPKPKEFEFKNIDEIINSTNSLDFNHEGYVVVDKYFHRAKIKSKLYVSIHHLITNKDDPNLERLINVVRQGELSEVSIYFPELNKQLVSLQERINYIKVSMNTSIHDAKQTVFLNRKDFAEYANKTVYPPLMFAWYDNKIQTANEFIDNLSAYKLAKLLEVCNH